MKNARPQNTEASALDKRNCSKFSGTDNPRHLRAIAFLLTRPALIAELRRRGLEAPCVRVQDRDRDGFPIRRGVYHFTVGDRRALRSWMDSR